MELQSTHSLPSISSNKCRNRKSIIARQWIWGKHAHWHLEKGSYISLVSRVIGNSCSCISWWISELLYSFTDSILARSPTHTASSVIEITSNDIMYHSYSVDVFRWQASAAMRKSGNFSYWTNCWPSVNLCYSLGNNSSMVDLSGQGVWFFEHDNWVMARFGAHNPPFSGDLIRRETKGIIRYRNLLIKKESLPWRYLKDTSRFQVYLYGLVRTIKPSTLRSHIQIHDHT